MNPLAKELNEIIASANPEAARMLSEAGRQLFFPRGILSQGAEAKEKAHYINATIGIAKEKGHTMAFDSVMANICDLPASQSLTYAPSYGIPELRRHWKQALVEKNPGLAGKDFSLPVVTCGITHGVSLFGTLWVDPGETVLLPDMMWGNYNMILSVMRGIAIDHYPLFSGDGGLDLAGLERSLTEAAAERGKVNLILNFPHNPSGYAPTTAEGGEICRILLKLAEAGTRVVVALDDSYFGLFYEPETMRESLFARLCGLHPRILAIKLDGATKENFVWGLRVGFITYGTGVDGEAGAFYEALEKKTAGAVRGSISNASHLSQSIVLKSMQSSAYAREKKEKFDILAARARRVREVLSDERYADAWDVYPFNAGYFMCIRLKRVNAEKLRRYLLDKYGIGLISIGEHNLRIAFSCVEEDLIKPLFDSILKGVRELET